MKILPLFRHFIRFIQKLHKKIDALLISDVRLNIVLYNFHQSFIRCRENTTCYIILENYEYYAPFPKHARKACRLQFSHLHFSILMHRQIMYILKCYMWCLDNINFMFKSLTEPLTYKLLLYRNYSKLQAHSLNKKTYSCWCFIDTKLGVSQLYVNLLVACRCCDNCEGAFCRTKL